VSDSEDANLQLPFSDCCTERVEAVGKVSAWCVVGGVFKI